MKKLFSLLVVLLLSAPALSFAQASAVNPLSLKLGLGGGLSSGQGDFSDFSGINYGGKVKLSIAAIPFTLVGHVHLNDLTAEFGSNEVELDLTSIGAGIEYKMMPLPIFSPYLCADIATNSFSSDDSDSESRVGAGFGAGTEINLPMFPISFDLEAKYRLNNISGKEDGEGDINHIQITAQAMFNIL
jgi:opacity protein-like surface antigen